MKKKNKLLSSLGISLGILFGTALLAYALTTLFYSKTATSNFTKKTIFQFDLSINLSNAQIGPGDSFYCQPVVSNDATEDMYVFIVVETPTLEGESIYEYSVDEEAWVKLDFESGVTNEGKVVYAYANNSVMTTLTLAESTPALMNTMTMKNISNAEYANIDDINVVITAYAIGTEDVEQDPADAWVQCKQIGNIE